MDAVAPPEGHLPSSEEVADQVGNNDLEKDQVLYTTFIRLTFTPYAIHFKSPRFMKESTMERLDMDVLKKTLHLTRDKSHVR